MPETEIFDVDFDDKKIDLVEGGYDLAIRIAKLEDSNLIARKITSTRMVLCASQKYLKEYGTPVVPQDLTTKHKKLLYKKAHETWHFIDDKAKIVSIKLPTALTSNNGNFLLESAIKGGGLLNVPDFICYKAIKQGKLQLVLNNYLVHTTIPIYALYPQNRHLSHRIRRLVDFLVEYYGDKPYWLI